MANLLKILIVWVVLLLSTTTATAARIYKYMGEDGLIHFTNCFPGKPDCLPHTKPKGEVEIIEKDFSSEKEDLSKIKDPFETAEVIVRRSKPDSKGEYHRRFVIPDGWVFTLDLYPSRSVFRLTIIIPGTGMAESYVRYKYESFGDKFNINTGRYTTVPIISEFYTRERWVLSAAQDVSKLGIKKGEPAILHEDSLSKAEAIALINRSKIMDVLNAEWYKK